MGFFWGFRALNAGGSFTGANDDVERFWSGNGLKCFSCITSAFTSKFVIIGHFMAPLPFPSSPLWIFFSGVECIECHFISCFIPRFLWDLSLEPCVRCNADFPPHFLFFRLWFLFILTQVWLRCPIFCFHFNSIEFPMEFQLQRGLKLSEKHNYHSVDVLFLVSANSVPWPVYLLNLALTFDRSCFLARNLNVFECHCIQGYGYGHTYVG